MQANAQDENSTMENKFYFILMRESRLENDLKDFSYSLVYLHFFFQKKPNIPSYYRRQRLLGYFAVLLNF